MMHMTFYWGKTVTILFDSWKTTTWTSYYLSLLAVFLVAAFYQYLEDLRLKVKSLSLSKSPAPASDSSTASTPLLVSALRFRRGAGARLAVATLFGINAAIGYMLMLAVMSFNAGVLIAAVIGLAVGYLAFRSGGEEDLLTVEVENACACA